MSDYSVTLTEKEVKDLGLNRWGRRVWWKLVGAATGGVVWCFISAFASMPLRYDSSPILGWLVFSTGMLPIAVFVVWYWYKVKKVSQSFLEQVKNEDALSTRAR